MKGVFSNDMNYNGEQEERENLDEVSPKVTGDEVTSRTVPVVTGGQMVYVISQKE